MNPRRPVAPGQQAASTSLRSAELQSPCRVRVTAICRDSAPADAPVQHVAPPGGVAPPAVAPACCTAPGGQARSPFVGTPRARGAISGGAEARRVEVEAPAPALDLHPGHPHLPRHRAHVSRGAPAAGR